MPATTLVDNRIRNAAMRDLPIGKRFLIDTECDDHGDRGAMITCRDGKSGFRISSFGRAHSVNIERFRDESHLALPNVVKLSLESLRMTIGSYKKEGCGGASQVSHVAVYTESDGILLVEGYGRRHTLYVTDTRDD
mmetsp:Transcript_2806/g.6277  ORF Transcript_2806/g.6277 Transcript_2806/m.6277 type:complete len:136 (+) Transcript_2806:149-556(+)